jgi:hypothetical protein
VTAQAAGLEEIASAMPMPFIVGHSVVTVVPGENYMELLEYDPIPFLCVTLGFLNFADHSGVHNALFLSIGGEIKNSTRGSPGVLNHSIFG